MSAIEKLIDKLPLATILSLSAVVIAFVGYLNGDLTVFQALSAAGISSAGAGVLGHARNGAGRGTK